MDLQLILRVLWRFRAIVAGGLVIATGLAVMSYVRIDPGGDPAFKYRQSEKWESLSTLFVTSRGFPWGSIGVDERPTGATPRSDENASDEEASGQTSPNSLDPVHLTGLAALYVRLATSDPVLERVGELPEDAVLQAFPVQSTDTGRGEPLPMVTLSAIGASAQEAQELARRHAAAFMSFIGREQRRAHIPLDERVVVEVVRQPSAAELLEGRKKTRPLVVFVAFMIAVAGVAFALENLRPRVRALPEAEALEPVPAPRTRRSA
jgi:hypothetical protein